eukprot:628206_1
MSDCNHWSLWVCSNCSLSNPTANEKCVACFQPRNPECICGALLVLKDAKDCYPENDLVHCDICNTQCHGISKIYHCNQQLTTKHDKGWDLCLTCAAVPKPKKTHRQSIETEHPKQQHTAKTYIAYNDMIDSHDDQDTISKCICGQLLQLQSAETCYDEFKEVYCEVCSVVFEGKDPIFHCTKGSTRVHVDGYDICKRCATKNRHQFSTKLLLQIKTIVNVKMWRLTPWIAQTNNLWLIRSINGVLIKRKV